MKLRNKILLFCLPAFIIPFLVLGYISATYTARSIRGQIVENLTTVILARNDQILSYLNEKKEAIVLMAASTVFRDFLSLSPDDSTYKTQYDRALQRLKRTVASDQQMYTMLLMDAKGRVVASTNESELGADKSEDPIFTKGKEGPFIKDVYFSDSLQKIAFGVSAPILDDATKSLLGVVAARINVGKFNSIMANTAGLFTSGETFLVNEDKKFVTPSRFLENSVLTISVDTQNVRECFSHTSKETLHVQEYLDYRGVRILGSHLYIPEAHWCLVAKVDQSEVNAPIVQAISISIILGAVGICTFLFIIILISRQITRSLEALERGIRKFGEGALDIRVGMNGNDEIGMLSRTFDDMAKNIREARADVDQKVKEQTVVIQEKSVRQEDQQKAILNILDDVEDEKSLSERRAQDLQKFQLAVENASDHIVITDSDGIILYANKAVERITGFLPKDIIGKKAGNKELWGGLMELPFYEAMWKTIKSDQKTFSGEINNRRKSGERYIALASISPIKDSSGSVSFFIGIERDITREKDIDRMKTEFISLASHQLRTPLSAMKWFSEMLLDGDAGALTKEQTEYVHNINESNERMIELVNSLLNISRIESGRLIIDPKPTDVKALVADVLKELDQKLKEKNQSCVVSVHENLNLISLDPKLIRQVFINLLTNAIKYTDKGGEIQIFLSKNDTDLISQISDNGFGIPKEEQGRVFEKFFRGRNIVKMETEGTGLGLYLIKAIIESSGGKLWFESDTGDGAPGLHHGTTFWFSVPLSGMVAKQGEVGLEEKKVELG